MKSELLSLVLSDDRVKKFTRPCPFCTRQYDQTSEFFGLWPKLVEIIPMLWVLGFHMEIKKEIFKSFLVPNRKG